MMILPLDHQVPTRETCEKLLDAGFRRDTWLCWKGGELQINFDEIGTPAPTLAELLEVLRTEGRDIIVEVGMPNHPASSVREVGWPWHTHENPAEAAALLWLKVKEGSDA